MGICPNEYPFLLTLNTTSTPDSVKILASPLMPYGFDLFSAYMGCVANTPTQNDDGSVSYQPQGVPCTIVATGKKDHGSPVTETFEYTAQTIQSTDPGSSTYKAVQYFDFTSPAWHNITFLTFNATTTKTPEFPYAPVLYIDNPSYGAMVETPPQSPNYLNGSINVCSTSHFKDLSKLRCLHSDSLRLMLMGTTSWEMSRHFLAAVSPFQGTKPTMQASRIIARTTMLPCARTHPPTREQQM